MSRTWQWLKVDYFCSAIEDFPQGIILIFAKLNECQIHLQIRRVWNFCLKGTTVWQGTVFECSPPRFFFVENQKKIVDPVSKNALFACNNFAIVSNYSFYFFFISPCFVVECFFLLTNKSQLAGSVSNPLLTQWEFSFLDPSSMFVGITYASYTSMVGWLTNRLGRKIPD